MSETKLTDLEQDVLTKMIEAVEQILNARVKPVNEDRIKEIITEKCWSGMHDCGVNGIDECAHALTAEFAVPVKEDDKDKRCYSQEWGSKDHLVIGQKYVRKDKPFIFGNKFMTFLGITPDGGLSFEEGTHKACIWSGGKFEEYIAVPCDHEPLDELTSLKQRIDGITVEDLMEMIARGLSLYSLSISVEKQPWQSTTK